MIYFEQVDTMSTFGSAHTFVYVRVCVWCNVYFINKAEKHIAIGVENK